MGQSCEVDGNGIPVQCSMSLIDLLQNSVLFPAVHTALCIALATPATTCTMECSFSTSRCVKTWLRSTMNNDRLSGLCIIDREFEFYEFFSFLKFNEFYEFFSG